MPAIWAPAPVMREVSSVVIPVVVEISASSVVFVPVAINRIVSAALASVKVYCVVFIVFFDSVKVCINISFLALSIFSFSTPQSTSIIAEARS